MENDRSDGWCKENVTLWVRCSDVDTERETLRRMECVYRVGSHHKTVWQAEEPWTSFGFFFFPTVSDPDILTWISQPSQPFDECRNMVGQRTAVHIMCVGQPLNIISKVKVSFLSSDRKIARGPWRGEVIVENQMVLIQKAWSPFLLPPGLWVGH